MLKRQRTRLLQVNNSASKVDVEARVGHKGSKVESRRATVQRPTGRSKVSASKVLLSARRRLVKRMMVSQQGKRATKARMAGSKDKATREESAREATILHRTTLEAEERATRNRHARLTPTAEGMRTALVLLTLSDREGMGTRVRKVQQCRGATGRKTRPEIDE